MEQRTRDVAGPSVSSAALEHGEHTLTEPTEFDWLLFTKETDGHACIDTSDEPLQKLFSGQVCIEQVGEYGKGELRGRLATGVLGRSYQQDHGVENRPDRRKQGLHNGLEAFRLFEQPHRTQHANGSDCIDGWYLSSRGSHNTYAHDASIEDTPGVHEK